MWYSKRVYDLWCSHSEALPLQFFGNFFFYFSLIWFIRIFFQALFHSLPDYLSLVLSLFQTRCMSWHVKFLEAGFPCKSIMSQVSCPSESISTFRPKLLIHLGYCGPEIQSFVSTIPAPAYSVFSSCFHVLFFCASVTVSVPSPAVSVLSPVVHPGIFKPRHSISLAAVTDDLCYREPKSYIEALKHPVWKTAMQ